jgi:hypothetical protein
MSLHSPASGRFLSSLVTASLTGTNGTLAFTLSACGSLNNYLWFPSAFKCPDLERTGEQRASNTCASCCITAAGPQHADSFMKRRYSVHRST